MEDLKNFIAFGYYCCVSVNTKIQHPPCHSPSIRHFEYSVGQIPISMQAKTVV